MKGFRLILYCLHASAFFACSSNERANPENYKADGAIRSAENPAILDGFVQKSENVVYICTGPKSYAYHLTTYCRGLRRCSAQVHDVSVAKAKAIGRRPCRFCY
ncbi:MAG: hypothetical protein RMM53_11035 [Bacteroidia bacterium]|nr:hypothetical protein [Bacteroidia bacterium]MDW8334740.1 hypothetical protein [Bacteroidia bacterium]